MTAQELLTKYEAELRKQEAIVLRLQGAVAALKQVVQEGADGDNQRLRDASGDSGAAGD